MEPIPLNLNNNQEQISSLPTSTENTVTFAGNVIGQGSSSANTTAANATTPSFSNILLYGCIGLFVVFILKKIGA